MKRIIDLHEIVGYMPYELTCMHGSDDDLKFGVVNGIDWAMNCPEVRINMKSVPFELFHPILKPMSDLASIHYFNLIKKAKPESVTDGDFEKLWKMVHYIFISPLAAPYWFVQKLYSENFDIHNLIDQGLAIDFNTVHL